jgi:Fic-DOC domain mobile mystery protein B
LIKFDKYGETPLDDISGLKLKIGTRAQLDNAEAENILDAYIKYTANPALLKKVKFDTQFLTKLHKEMFGNVWKWAGDFRTTGTSIGAEPIHIRTKLYQLIDDLGSWEKDWNYKDVAVRLHHALVKIHPFPNGNGRWARLATDIWLLKNGHLMLSWGEGDLDRADENRKKYIDALKEADDYNYLVLKRFLFGES